MVIKDHSLKKARKQSLVKKFNKDRDVTDSALLFPHIFIYEASAGSGKTRRLAQRYVDFLFTYPNKTPLTFGFRNILAVTFTNEAADQMKQEILKILKLKALRKSKYSCVAMEIVDEIIRNFSDFAIRTIDSFVHSLLVASSLELKLPPEYEIISHSKPYLEYVLDNLLDEIPADRDMADLFSDLVYHFLIIEGQKDWNPKRILLGLLDKFYREENGRAKTFLEIKSNLNLAQAEKELKTQIRQFLSSLSTLPSVNRQFVKGINFQLEKTGSGLLKGIISYINKPLLPGRGILNKCAAKPDLDLLRMWEELRECCDRYARDFVWMRYSIYLKVFNKFRQRLENFKEMRRIVFLGELNKKARKLLSSEGFLPAEIYYKLSSIFYHYLIDEFQDTSILQWENMQPLIEDALSRGGSLFYVGDKKQAIYRFRGGEVALFDSIKDRFRNQVSKIYDEVLLFNYRSGENIVKFNNLVFGRDNLKSFLERFTMLDSEFRERILAVFKDSRQKTTEARLGRGYVRLEKIEQDSKEQLLDSLNIKLKRMIQEIVERFDYRDILILVRDNEKAELLAGFLLEQGFPVCASRTVCITQNYIVRQIISLLKFLNSPIDDLCFANFILGDIFLRATGLQLDRLQSWLEVVRLQKREGALYTKFRSAYSAIWQRFLQYLFNAVGFLPVYDLVQAILLQYNVENNFPHLSGFIRRLLEILNNLQEQGKNSLSDFLEWLGEAQEEELFVQLPEGLDAIRVLTIHRAKGLSSPVVILPYASLEVKVGEAGKVVYESDDGLYFLYLQKEICKSQPHLNSIYQREYYQAFLDELNCLYVALTRAANELYIFLPQIKNRSYNPLIPFLLKDKQEAGLAEFGYRESTLSRKRPVKDRVIPDKQLTKALPQEVLSNLLRKQFIPPEQIVPLNKRYLSKRGELFHYLLADINPFIFLKDPSYYVQSIKDACRLFNYSYSEEISRCLSELFRMPQMQEFFNPDFEAFNEKEIVDQYGHLKRIDRLVFTGEDIWIIDYKTGEESREEYRKQIEEYAYIIKQFYPDKAIECWLVYIDTREILQVIPGG